MDVEALLSRATRNPETECWEWGGHLRNGYGRVFWDGRKQSAHRVVFEQLCEPIPEGLTIDHLCRVPHCVNPDHLEPVTQRENNERGNVLTARHARKTHCPQGHPYDEENTYRWRNRRYCKRCQGWQ